MQRTTKGEGAPLKERANAEWIEALQSPVDIQNEALDDLRKAIRFGLPYALSQWLSPDDPHFDSLADEVAQDTLVRVLERIHTFEGRSKFTTWAHKIAIRIALTELRRKRWEDVSLEGLVAQDDAPPVAGIMADTAADPDLAAERSDLAMRIQRIILEELSERQRTAMIAIAIHGMPIEVTAERMGMKRNALYKLMHDARVRLKTRMLEEGMDPLEVLNAYEAR
jgi:RNA polymerase sigma factor (sigma-70 family)